MKPIVSALTLLACASLAQAETLPFELRITGAGIDVQRQLELSDLGEGKTAHHLELQGAEGRPYRLDLNYKALPKNRSFPSNLDITLSDADGKYHKQDGQTHLLERIDYRADSIETLREGMFAGKYFDPEAGTFKLVYYPALGQTQPPR